ncbi:MAG TPA: T9SS type A sorting domain-containing protein [Saprospiraceae bacterium]|nr:T9SS type A sorting domain-containing protein [Saprospiraceae bacterium]
MSTQLNTFDKSQPTLQVFPNPAHEAVSIKFPGNFQYELFNVNGFTARNGTGNDELRLDVSGFTSGIYLLKVKSGVNTQNATIVILR